MSFIACKDYADYTLVRIQRYDVSEYSLMMYNIVKIVKEDSENHL